jgi:hypothetical protein
MKAAVPASRMAEKINEPRKDTEETRIKTGRA